MGDSAYTTHHTSPGMTHCHQKCVSKYLRNAKNSTYVDSRVYYTVSTYVEKIEPGNFLPYAFLMAMHMGQQNDPSLTGYERMDSTIVRSTYHRTVAEAASLCRSCKLLPRLCSPRLVLKTH
jgi:hypothetical protein